MKKYDDFLKSIEERLQKLPREIPEGVAEAYVGGGKSVLTYLGLKVPTLDAVYKKGFDFGDEPQRVWDYIWKTSPIYEVMSLALSWFDDKKRRSTLFNYWPLLKTWIYRIDNWAHSDVLSGMIARLLEAHPKEILPTLEEWSKSENPWMRRASIVGLIYYAGAREKFPPFSVLKKLVERQIEVDHHYVQRGVGWTLREMYTAYPEKTAEYLKKNAPRLSAIAFSAAVEKVPRAIKETLKKERAQFRKKATRKR